MMKIPQSLAPAIEYFRRHVSNEMVSNERLVLLLGSAVATILFSAFYGLWSLTSHTAQQLATSKNSLARLQMEVTDDAWPKRVDISRDLKTQLSARFWDAETLGLAEAGFESWLRARFGKYGEEPQQIQITRSPALGRDGQTSASLAGIQRMTAKVIAPFDQSVVLQVLADAAEADKIIVVDRLIIRAGANSRLEMDISTFTRAGDTLSNTAKAKP
jgi:hypothetical protein